MWCSHVEYRNVSSNILNTAAICRAPPPSAVACIIANIMQRFPCTALEYSPISESISEKNLNFGISILIHHQRCTIIIVRSISSDNSCFAKIENDIISQSEKMHRSGEEASERTQLCIENANIGLCSCSPLQCDDGQDIYLTISAAPANIRLGQQISENEKNDLRLFEISRIFVSFLSQNEINSRNNYISFKVSNISEVAGWSVNKSKIFGQAVCGKLPSSALNLGVMFI